MILVISYNVVLFSDNVLYLLVDLLVVSMFFFGVIMALVILWSLFFCLDVRYCGNEGMVVICFKG